jgi:hypothetical protein
MMMKTSVGLGKVLEGLIVKALATKNVGYDELKHHGLIKSRQNY